MNAVIYARYSSTGQRDVSIEDQVREIEHFAKLHDYTIINTYADRAMTGRNDKRPQFRQMMHDATKKLFSIVLVYKYDRFARNQYDAVVNKKRLADAGVKVIAVMEPIPDGHGAKILEAIYEAMAEEYSENLSQNVLRGMKGNAMKAMVNCRPSFGYKINKETRKYEADPQDAPIVQTIFKMVLSGKPQKEVLAYMKSIGKPRSLCWLYTVLKNERYTGVYIFGDVRVESGMPQLISKEDFEKVRMVMNKRKHTPQANPYKFPLSGKAYCGKCGSLIVGETAINHAGIPYRYYVCGRHKKRAGGCSLRRRRADLLEKVIADGLRNVLMRPDVVDNLVENVYSCMMESKGIRLESLESELKEKETRINNIQRNVERVANVPVTLLERLSELEKERDLLLAEMDAERLQVRLSKKDIKSFILNFNTEYDDALIRTFVTKVVLYDDHAIVKYDAGDNNTVEVSLNKGSITSQDTSTISDVTRTFYIENATLFVVVKF